MPDLFSNKSIICQTLRQPKHLWKGQRYLYRSRIADVPDAKVGAAEAKEIVESESRGRTNFNMVLRGGWYKQERRLYSKENASAYRLVNTTPETGHQRNRIGERKAMDRQHWTSWYNADEEVVDTVEMYKAMVR
ncbi:MAG: hypothetical protein LQ346_006663 [Caloplaca aetnensis]|nr:MAG: hypothetical protein LQ346_006663 [Caloplaca aetnensis]